MHPALIAPNGIPSGFGIHLVLMIEMAQTTRAISIMTIFPRIVHYLPRRVMRARAAS